MPSIQQNFQWVLLEQVQQDLQPKYSTPGKHSASVKCTQCNYEEDPVDDRLDLVLYEMNITLQKSAQIVLNHCKSLSVMIHLHHCSYLKSIQIISHSEKQLDLKKMIG